MRKIELIYECGDCKRKRVMRIRKPSLLQPAIVVYTCKSCNATNTVHIHHGRDPSKPNMYRVQFKITKPTKYSDPPQDPIMRCVVKNADGNEMGFVEATTQAEAEEKAGAQYPGFASVEEAPKELSNESAL